MSSIDEMNSFLVGTLVRHRTLGIGLISAFTPDEVHILFDDGVKCFKTDSFFQHFVLDESDVYECFRKKHAIQNCNIIHLEIAKAYQPLLNCILSSNHFDVVFDGEKCKFGYRLSSIDMSDIKPFRNFGQIQFSREHNCLELEFSLLYLIDNNAVQDFFEDNWFAEKSTDLLNSLVLVAKIFDKESHYTTYIADEYENKQKEVVFSNNDLVIGIDFKKLIRCSQDFTIAEELITLYMQSARDFIGFLALKTDCNAVQTNDDVLRETEVRKEAVNLTFKDFLIVSNRRTCISSCHDMEEVNAVLNVILPDGKKVKRIVPAYCCSVCNEYYIYDFEYYRVLDDGGIPLCRVCTEELYRKQQQNNFSTYATNSQLRLYGYSVNKNVNLTDIQRRAILNLLIKLKIMKTQHIKSFIFWLLDSRKGRKDCRDAIRKWRADIEYLNKTYHSNARKVCVASLSQKKYVYVTRQ